MESAERKTSPRRGRGWRPGLLGRVALALAVVGLVPLAVASYRLIELNRDAMWEQVLRTHVTAAGTAAARVESFLAARRELAAATASHPALGEPASAADLLSGLLESSPEVAAAVLLAPGGGEILRAQRREVAARVEPLIRSARGTVVERLGDRLWLRLEVPLPGGRGTLVLVTGAAPLEAAMSPVSLGDEAALSLLAADGALVAGAPVSAGELPPELLAAAGSSRLAGAGPYRGAGGETVLAAYDAVDGTPWFVVSRQPARVADAVARRMARGSLWSLALALVLVAALSALAWANLVRPIRELNRAQRRLMGRGAESGGDELAQLRDSFAVLERRVRDREALEEVFLGRYQVLEVLGQGAMGVVFRGWDPKLHRPVALKTVRLDDPADGRYSRQELASRLLAEAVTAARFNHPNIVAVYDVEDRVEVAFLAMELVEGMSLAAYLQRRGKLSSGETALVGAAVARGLAAAHRRDVAHHDVKPANVLLGRGGEIKVADFGIARAVSSLAEGSGRVFGTPGYLAPETLEGRGYDARSDLFALGVVLYECLAGRPPFTGRGVRDTVLRTLVQEVEPPHLEYPDIDEELSGLVVRLLAKEPDRRPVDEARLIAQLEDAVWRLGAPAQLPLVAPGEEKYETVPRESPHSRFVATRGPAAASRAA